MNKILWDSAAALSVIRPHIILPDTEKQTDYSACLMNLLCYSGALNFCGYGHSMSGPVYHKKPIGALPVFHYELMLLSVILSEYFPRLNLMNQLFLMIFLGICVSRSLADNNQ